VRAMKIPFPVPVGHCYDHDQSNCATYVLPKFGPEHRYGQRTSEPKTIFRAGLVRRMSGSPIGSGLGANLADMARNFRVSINIYACKMSLCTSLELGCRCIQTQITTRALLHVLQMKVWIQRFGGLSKFGR
jgi:hypothetical protein